MFQNTDKLKSRIENASIGVRNHLNNLEGKLENYNSYNHPDMHNNLNNVYEDDNFIPNNQNNISSNEDLNFSTIYNRIGSTPNLFDYTNKNNNNYINSTYTNRDMFSPFLSYDNNFKENIHKRGVSFNPSNKYRQNFNNNIKPSAILNNSNNNSHNKSPIENMKKYENNFSNKNSNLTRNNSVNNIIPRVNRGEKQYMSNDHSTFFNSSTAIDYLNSGLNNHLNPVNLETINRKFSIIFREVTSMRESKSEMALINNSLQETRKMFFIVKNQLEEQLKNFELLIYNSLEIDGYTNKEFNLLPDNATVFGGNIGKTKEDKLFGMAPRVNQNKKQDMLNNVMATISNNTKIIDAQGNTVNAIEKKVTKNTQLIDEISRNLFEKSSNLESRSSLLEKNSGDFDLRLTNLEDKYQKQLDYLDKNNKDLKTKLTILEEKLLKKITKVEEVSQNDINNVEEKLSENLNTSKAQLEERLNKQSKKEMDSLRNVILNEVSMTVWEKKRGEIIKEVDDNMKESENKLNENFEKNLDSYKVNVDDQLLKFNDVLGKLETEHKNLTQSIDNLNKTVVKRNTSINPGSFHLKDAVTAGVNLNAGTFFGTSNSNNVNNQNTNSKRFTTLNSSNNNKMVMFDTDRVNNNTPFSSNTGNIQSKNSYGQGTAKNTSKLSSFSNNKLTGGTNTLRKSKIDELIRDSDEEEDDDIISNNRSKQVNDSIKNKNIFSRFSVQSHI